ncbi:hypothetical protein C2G38_2139000 [Gigaspora rosea]|uniref:Uncharacterized protein n=1 Tax=Gigaspora rosea TaxID=44941 RepID=A0A397VVJ8_9GLOM|nr:hypothetical protein C2G38_2139000 [Gigaspora rosea]
MFVMSCGFHTSESQSVIYDNNCNKYITAPLEKDGSYYNGYFSIPFEHSYKLVLSNNTKLGKRGEQRIRFLLQFLDLNVDRNTSSSFFIQFSDSEVTPQLTKPRGDIFTDITVSLDFDITTVETEQRSHTILSSLGLIGGAWSLAVCVYKLLFGDDAIRPFGLIQKRGYFYEQTQKRLTKFLSTLPLVQLLDSSKNIDDDDESRVDQLEKQINDLELFLRDYVVDAQQLDKAYINNERDKDK